MSDSDPLSNSENPKEFERFDGVGSDAWIDANEALALVEGQLGGAPFAKATLSDKLRDGPLRAVASATWLSTERGLTKALRESEAEGVITNVLLHPLAFRKSKNFTLDTKEWRWPYNKFFVTHRKRQLTRRAFIGVRFSREDLSRWFDLSKPKVLRKKDEWESFWFAVIELAHEGRLTEDHFRTQKELREEILLKIGDALSDRHIKVPVQSIWKRFVQGSHG